VVVRAELRVEEDHLLIQQLGALQRPLAHHKRLLAQSMQRDLGEDQDGDRRTDHQHRKREIAGEDSGH
jgi:hypothetical protein